MVNKIENGYAFVSNRGGHRESYVETLSKVTGLMPLVDGRRFRNLPKLVQAKCLLFVSMEDDIRYFLLVTLARCILQRRTLVIVMNSHRVLEGGGWSHRAKGLMLKLLRSHRSVKTLSIIPFYLDERLRSYSNDWIYDPQFWDLQGSNCLFKETNLSKKIEKAASHRKILLYLGNANKKKGFDFLLSCIEEYPQICKSYLVLAAGKMNQTSEAEIERFVDAGGMCVDRYLTEEEVLSLKDLAYCFWTCYHPSYNSSSGLFGRACQFRKHVIVRKGSLLEGIAQVLGYPVKACTYNDIESVLCALIELSEDSSNILPEGVGTHCRKLSVDKLLDAISVEKYV